ncbi:MAG TPA: septal ring lytic transglycosylase RlpA family protein [Usitatibacter sp.]|nr:septal ring lytic transglycosylase RlpA family protein [Usitatibacter sp.]
MIRAAVLLALVALLAGCGTLRKQESAAGGKYYQDDGPPESVPDGLADLPDAVPRDEPFHKYANRPYTVFGRTYVPVVNKDAYKERGLASWYGRKFHGQKTSSGETYDMFAMTAAHKTLPIPSFARVTNLENGKSVVVRINDRGPFHSNRIIDLSYAAAKKLGILGKGSAMVEVERVFAGMPAQPPVQAKAQPPSPPAPEASAIESPMVAKETNGLWLQLGAFGSTESAEQFRERLARDLSVRQPIQVVTRDGLSRVRLGPFRTLEEAAAAGDKVREALGFAPTLVEH